MEVVDDVCESEGVCEVLCNAPFDEPEQGESMETHECEEDAVRSAATASTENAPASAQGTKDTAPQKLQYSYRSAFTWICVKMP